jgi:hypothetical protein
MAGKVFFSVTMSLDGFVAPESLEDLMGQQWMELQQWMFPQRFIRENLKLGEGGEEGRDNDIVRETFERTGAAGSVMSPATDWTPAIGSRSPERLTTRTDSPRRANASATAIPTAPAPSTTWSTASIRPPRRGRRA